LASAREKRATTAPGIKKDNRQPDFNDAWNMHPIARLLVFCLGLLTRKAFEVLPVNST
jgi:hypothetical protein